VGGVIIDPMFRERHQDQSPVLKQFLNWSAAEPELGRNELLESWIRRDTLRSEFLARMREYPILLCPPAAIPAFRHGERTWIIDGNSVHYLDAWSYTAWFNLLGNPAAVIPVRQSADGLPIGVQIVGRPWEEEKVLAVAAEVEKAAGGWRKPKLC